MFGKFTGKTLPQVVFADLDYFFWLHDENILHGRLRLEAEEIHRKATAIRLPQPGLVAEYTYHPALGFFGVDLVPENRAAHEGSARTTRLPFFNLSVPRMAAPYDKAGGRLLVRSVKFHLFGDPNFKMTRQRCEEFFDDDDNFGHPAAAQPGGDPG